MTDGIKLFGVGHLGFEEFGFAAMLSRIATQRSHRSRLLPRW